MQIDLVIQNVVLAIHALRSASDAEGKFGECGYSAFKHDSPLQISEYGFGILFALASRSCAQFVHILLRFRLRESAFVDTKGSLQLHLLEEWFFSRRNFCSGLECDRSRHWCATILDKQAEDVFDSSLPGRQIEQCGLAFALFRSLDAAFHDEVGSTEVAIHAFQECVAVNGINERSELGRKLDCMAARSDLEVGNVGGARDIDVLENSAVFSFGRQCPRDAAVNA